MTQYRALVGIDYPPDKRAEAGELVSDLPEKSVTWLLAQGLIETTDGKSSKKSAVKVEEPVVEVKEETPVITVDDVAFDANASDGDGDGFVQDGTPFQRPVEEK
jgi:hypothetical protein